jgi:hypothetical protein
VGLAGVAKGTQVSRELKSLSAMEWIEQAPSMWTARSACGAQLPGSELDLTASDYEKIGVQGDRRASLHAKRSDTMRAKHVRVGVCGHCAAFLY